MNTDSETLTINSNRRIQTPTIRRKINSILPINQNKKSNIIKMKIIKSHLSTLTFQWVMKMTRTKTKMNTIPTINNT